MTTIDIPPVIPSPPETPAKRAKAIILAMLVGFIGIGMYAITEHSWAVLGCGLVIAAAAALVGGLVGFLFGLPKTTTAPTPPTITSAATTTSTTVGAAPDASVATTTVEYQGNTNLEQISDWLTKILLGAGLVELREIRNAFNILGTQLSHDRCLGSCGWVVGPATIIAYGIGGFLISYLWARIDMINELRRAGAELLNRRDPR